MIRFDKEKVLLLHQMIAQETGGSIGVRDVGLSVASGTMKYEHILAWINKGKKQ